MDLATKKALARSVFGSAQSPTPYTSRATVTRIVDGIPHVLLPGAEEDTPASSVVGVSVGDIVNVSISHHDTYISGNRSDASVTSTEVDGTVGRAKREILDELEAKYIKADSLEAMRAKVGDLTVDNLLITGKLQLATQTAQAAKDAADATLIFDTSYTVVESNGSKQAVFTPHVYRGGVDVTDEFEEGDFRWYWKRDESGTIDIDDPHAQFAIGKEYRASINDYNYGGTVIGVFEPKSQAALLTVEGAAVQDSGGTGVTVRTSAPDGCVRVTELSAITAVSQDDWLMGFTESNTYRAQVARYMDIAVARADEELEMTAAQAAALFTI